MTLITNARRQDAPALRRVMFNAVRQGAVAYSVAERRAWMPDAKVPPGWANALQRQSVWVARTCHGPVGFVSLWPGGYVDLAFVAPGFQGKGIFSALMARLLVAANGMELTTHASFHAQPAFAAAGFGIVHHEQVKRRGEVLSRAYMLCPERVA